MKFNLENGRNIFKRIQSTIIAYFFRTKKKSCILMVFEIIVFLKLKINKKIE